MPGATIDHPPRRLIGALTTINWNGDSNGAGKVVIDGCAAAFGTVAGGETFDLTGGAWGPTTVTLQAADATAAAVRDRINGTGGGIPAALAATTDGNRLVLADVGSKLQVSAISAATYAKIGLPQMERLAAQTAFRVPDSGPGGTVNAMWLRRDLVSEAFAIPTGATKLELELDVLTNDSTSPSGAIYAVGWGKASTTIANCLSPIYDEVEDATLVAGSGPVVASDSYGVRLRKVAGFPQAGWSHSLTRSLRIPVGMTQLYVLALAQHPIGAALPGRIPSRLTATVQAYAGE